MLAPLPTEQEVRTVSGGGGLSDAEGMKLSLLVGMCVVLSFGVADMAVVEAVASPIAHQNGTTTALQNGTTGGGGSEPAKATCFLNNFRGLTPDEASRQGINLVLLRTFKVSFGSVAFSLAMMGLGAVLLGVGGRLVTPVLFLAGFGAGFMFAFAALSGLFNIAPALFNCWVLGLLPMAVGCITGVLVQKTLDLAFFLTGAAMGLVFGKYAYGLGLYKCESNAGSVRWVYWACLLVPAVLCGVVGRKQQHSVLAFSTSLIGGFAFTVGACFLILHPIDRRFTDWISPSSFAHGGDGLSEDAHLDGYTLGPIFFAVVLSLLGTKWQMRGGAESGGLQAPLRM